MTYTNTYLEPALAAIIALILAVACAGAQTNQSYTVNYTPSPSVFLGSTNVTVPPDGYNLIVSSNAALPFAQWTTALAGVPASFKSPSSSNYVATTSTSFTIQMQPPIFVAMTYSNSSGVSPFSNIGGLQAFPVAGTITSIRSP